MRKLWITLIFLLIFLASIGIGYFYLNTRNDQKNSSYIETNIIANEPEYISTEQTEDMVSPNAEIMRTIYFNKCGHTETEIENVEKDMVNLNEDQLKEKFDDWEINYFSDKKISIYQEKDEYCPEHYIIGESEGLVNIYKLDKNGEDELYETTNIFLDYLPEADQEKIRDGIEVIGTKNLNSVLENYD